MEIEKLVTEGVEVLQGRSVNDLTDDEKYQLLFRQAYLTAFFAKLKEQYGLEPGNGPIDPKVVMLFQELDID